MSAPAINPAPPPTPSAPTPGANASAGGANGGQAAHDSQAQDPVAAFETMLTTLFGIKTPAAGAAASPGAKTAATGKTSGDEAKTKAAGDGQTAADATAVAGANPNLALLIPVAANLPAALPSQGAGGEDPIPTATAGPAVAVASPGAGATVADRLAKLAAGALLESDAGKAALAAPQTAAIPVDCAAIDASANATAKTDAAAPKIEVSTAPTPPATPTAAAAPATEASSAPSPNAAQTAQAVPAPETSAEAAAPVAPKERVQAIKTSTRVDSAKTATTPGGIAALTAKAADALQPVEGGAPKGGLSDKPTEPPLVEAKTDEPGAAPARGDPATSATTTPATLIHAATVSVRGSPQTVANLAAQIVKKLDGRSSQFNVQLDPAGLGKVDVRIAIGADGRMSAAMSFDTPQAAAELKARASELHQAMAQAGFDLTGGMSFDVASDRGQSQGQGSQAENQRPDAGAAFRGRAFQAALDTTADKPPPQYALRRTALAGVDIRI